MKDPKLNDLVERIKKEAAEHNLSPRQRGFEHGKREALNFGYVEFMKYLELGEDKDSINDFTNQEIEAFYLSIKPNQTVKKLRIRRIEKGNELEGVYHVVVEDVNLNILDTLKEADKPRYLKGWISGFHEIYKEVRTLLPR